MIPRLLPGFILWLATALVACAQNEPTAISTTAVPLVTEQIVEIVTPEPTPTTVVCTPLPDEIRIHIRRAGDLHGAVEVEGLQPGERPLLLLTAEAATASWRQETQPDTVVGADGRFQARLDFRSWPSVAGYQFAGRLIHDRGVACFEFSLPLTEAGESGGVENGRFLTAPVSSMLLSLADYPPGETPYFITEGDFWLVHAPAGQLIAFAATSPDYRPDIGLDACRFTWAESVGRFVDPCSGDEWTLDGRFSLAHSSERWSDRDLDQYRILRILEEEGVVNVQWDRRLRGLSYTERPLAVAAQLGVTVTVVAATFTPSGATISTLAQVSPTWGMDPSAFPPQQALAYATFPDSLIDDQGRAIPSVGHQGGFAVFDSQSSGLRQTMHNQWEPAAPDAEVVTATLTIDLSNLYRQVALPLEWASHQPGDAWEVDLPLTIGHAAARIQQVEWLATLADGRARLRLTVADESPDDIRLYCLHLDSEDPWQQACANFDGALTAVVLTQPGEPVLLHLRASLALQRPFSLALNVTGQE